VTNQADALVRPFGDRCVGIDFYEIVGLLSVKFLCVTLWHMSIHTEIVVVITLQQIGEKTVMKVRLKWTPIVSKNSLLSQPKRTKLDDIEDELIDKNNRKND